MKFIATSDWHLRADAPLCRIDPDWMETQRLNIRQVVDYANDHDCDIINAGDIFDVARTPPNVVTMFLEEIKNLKGKMYLIGGNHSIQYHKQEFLMESSLGILASLPNNEVIKYLPCIDNSEDGRFEHFVQLDTDTNDEVGICHTLTFKSSNDILFGIKGISAQKLLSKYQDIQYLITGDNHTPFVYDDEDADGTARFVINPGSLNIQTADAMDRVPCVYFVNTNKAYVKCLDLNPYREYITDDHLTQKHERDERISAFVETVKNGGKVNLSFDDNLASTLSTMDMSEELQGIFDELKQEA